VISNQAKLEEFPFKTEELYVQTFMATYRTGRKYSLREDPSSDIIVNLDTIEHDFNGGSKCHTGKNLVTDGKYISFYRKSWGDVGHKAEILKLTEKLRMWGSHFKTHTLF
jgi:hypothetical protein